MKLADHERNPPGEKSHPCNGCEMVFASRDGLGKLKRAFLVFAPANRNL